MNRETYTLPISCITKFLSGTRIMLVGLIAHASFALISYCTPIVRTPISLCYCLSTINNSQLPITFVRSILFLFGFNSS